MPSYLQNSWKSVHRTGTKRAHIHRCATMVIAFSLCSFNVLADEAPLLQQLRHAAASGDLRPVMRLVAELERDPSAASDELSRVLLQQFQERFQSPLKTIEHDGEITLVDGVISAYRQYWRSVLTRSTEPQEAEAALRARLRSLLALETGSAAPGHDLYEQLEQALAQQGFGSSAAATPPWRDLYIWRSERARHFKVSLTDTVEEVRVTFIEQPLIQGWQHFASLDLVTTSGWASASGLFCLCESYDLESTTFEVTWLKHETRHSVDLRLYPGMEESRMEYRAKLTELAFAGTAEVALLRQFTASGNEAGQSAHSRANYQVSRDLYREIFDAELPAGPNPWQALGPYRVAPAARRLLEKDTAAMRQAGHKPYGAEPTSN